MLVHVVRTGVHNVDIAKAQQQFHRVIGRQLGTLILFSLSFVFVLFNRQTTQEKKRL